MLDLIRQIRHSDENIQLVFKKWRFLKKLKRDKNLISLNNFDVIEQVASHISTHENSHADTYREMATFLLNIGQPKMAQKYFQLSLKHKFAPSTYSLYLQCLLLSPDCNDARMYQEAKKYNQFHRVKKISSTHFPTEKNTTILNIGYLCHFFHNSISPSLLLPFLKEHDHQRVRIFCYSDTEPDEVPPHIKNIADVWRDTKEMNDDELTSTIRNDKINILLELNGHCITNRYGVIARRAAPIQVSYYNINATTGLDAMDYILTSDEINLEKSSQYYSETIYYMKGVMAIAKFPDTFPECAPAPPCVSNSYVTFGSFGAAHKVNHEVIKVWCKILHRVPSSRFYMKAGVLSHDNYLNSYKKLFAAEGIDLNRIHFEGHSEHMHMLQCYEKVDIALDTFPHTGGTTTLEASWQGVPVLTWCGDRYSWQHGKMILSSIGHSELVTYSENEFIEKAVELAGSPQRLINYRKNLREDFRHSPKANVKAFTAKLEDTYFDMWHRKIQKNIGRS